MSSCATFRASNSPARAWLSERRSRAPSWNPTPRSSKAGGGDLRRLHGGGRRRAGLRDRRSGHQGGRITHLLNLSISTARLVPLLSGNLKPGWTAGVFDRKGLFVARSERHTELSGTPGPKDVVEATSGRQGIWRGTDLSGAPVLLGHAETTLAA